MALTMEDKKFLIHEAVCLCNGSLKDKFAPEEAIGSIYNSLYRIFAPPIDQSIQDVIIEVSNEIKNAGSTSAVEAGKKKLIEAIKKISGIPKESTATTFPGPHYALPYLRGSELFKICYQIVNPTGKNGPLAAADKASDLFKRLHLVITGFPVPSEQD